MCHIVKKIAWLLVVVGALNWGLVGFFNFNLVAFLLGTGIAAKIVYCLVGLSAIVLVVYKIKKYTGKKHRMPRSKARRKKRR